MAKRTKKGQKNTDFGTNFSKFEYKTAKFRCICGRMPNFAVFRWISLPATGH